MVTLQQQLRQKMADVVQQLRKELNETMRESTCATASTQRCRTCQQSQLVPSHIESVTSSQETGKAAMTRIISTLHVGPALVDASVVGSRRDDASTAPTSSTASHLQWIVQKRSQEQLKCHCTQYCDEQQQTNHREQFSQRKDSRDSKRGKQ